MKFHAFLFVYLVLFISPVSPRFVGRKLEPVDEDVISSQEPTGEPTSEPSLFPTDPIPLDASTRIFLSPLQDGSTADASHAFISGISSAPECLLLEEVITFSNFDESSTVTVYDMEQKSEGFWYGTERMRNDTVTTSGTASLYIASYPSSPGICFLSGRFESVQEQMTLTLKTTANGAISANFVKNEDVAPELELKNEEALLSSGTMQNDDSSTLVDGDDANIELLVAVTREAVCQEAGVAFPCEINERNLASAQTSVSMLLRELNDVVLKNSNFDVKVVQVGDLYVTEDFTENAEVNWMINALIGILEPNDGILDALPTERENVSADLAVLLTSSPDVSGDGILYGIASPGWGKDANFFPFISNFTPTSIALYTFSHEFGHMMGARHDNDDTNPPAKGFFSATGPDGSYSTIMTVLNTCSSSFFCTRLPVFSSQDMTFNGLTIGSTTADNRSEVERNVANVANYRASAGIVDDPGAVSVDGIVACESDCDCPESGDYSCLCAALAMERRLTFSATAETSKISNAENYDFHAVPVKTAVRTGGGRKLKKSKTSQKKKNKSSKSSKCDPVSCEENQASVCVAK